MLPDKSENVLDFMAIQGDNAYVLSRLEEYRQLGSELFNAGLDELGFRQVIKPEWRTGLVSSAIYPDDPNWSFEAVHDYCYQRGFTIYPGKISTTNTFRLCALGTITPKDIENFFVVLKDAMKAHHIQIPAIYK